MSERIELIQPILGMRPYVLLEVDADEDGDLAIKVKGGGGIASQDEILSLLLMAIETLTGVDADLYLNQINVARVTAGLSALAPD